jgi:hypothetical protein
MKKRWIVILALLTLLLFGAFWEIQLACDAETQRIIAWRILPPWSTETVSRDPFSEWFLRQTGTNRVCDACDARCYGLLGRGRVIVRQTEANTTSHGTALPRRP